MQQISRPTISKANTPGGSAMKSFQTLLLVALVLLLVTPATVLGAGEGRYQAITVFRGSTPMVFVLDTKNGNSWLWQKGSYTSEAGIREEWSTIHYQGRMIPGGEVTPGELISAPKWKLPDNR
jgi:hypothetical protein